MGTEFPTVERKGGFIKQFAGPKEASSVVCFPFWQLVLAEGCVGQCSYCYLMDLTPFRVGIYQITGTLFSNLRDIESETRDWLLKLTAPASLLLGELQDALCFESPYHKLLGITPLEILIPLFGSRETNPHGHVLIVLSKFTSTSWAERFGPQQNVVFSWSLSLPSISSRYERGVAPLRVRLAKARAMRTAGYRVRLRLDALAPIPDWERELDEVVARINEVQPEMLTAGALRATNVKTLRAAAERLGRDATIFDYITRRDSSRFKHRTDEEFQRDAFGRIREQLDRRIAFGLCKEEAGIWGAAGAEWKGCHCLAGEGDSVAHPRAQQLVQLKGRARRT
jgi:DNA repair photolyase